MNKRRRIRELEEQVLLLERAIETKLIQDHNKRLPARFIFGEEVIWAATSWCGNKQPTFEGIIISSSIRIGDIQRNVTTRVYVVADKSGKQQTVPEWTIGKKPKTRKKTTKK